jgi:hypothetical protein
MPVRMDAPSRIPALTISGQSEPALGWPDRPDRHDQANFPPESDTLAECVTPRTTQQTSVQAGGVEAWLTPRAQGPSLANPQYSCPAMTATGTGFLTVSRVAIAVLGLAGSAQRRAAQQAGGQSGAIRRFLVSLCRCIRRVSSPPGTAAPAEVVPGQAGKQAGFRATPTGLPHRAIRGVRTGRGLVARATTAAITMLSPVTPCWRSATRPQTLPLPRPGRLSPKGAPPAPGQHRPEARRPVRLRRPGRRARRRRALARMPGRAQSTGPQPGRTMHCLLAAAGSRPGVRRQLPIGRPAAASPAEPGRSPERQPAAATSRRPVR